MLGKAAFSRSRRVCDYIFPPTPNSGLEKYPRALSQSVLGMGTVFSDGPQEAAMSSK